MRRTALIFGKRQPRRFAALFAATSLLIAPSFLTLTTPAHAASFAPVEATNGMVVSAHPLASQAGVDILRQGGNAVDAAITVAYTLAVVYPAAGNLGGGGFMTIHLANGTKTFIDFREKAPAAASEKMFLDKDGNVVKDLSLKSHLAVGVPGTVAGMEFVREKYAKLPRATLMKHAIQYANKGFALAKNDLELFSVARDDLNKDPIAKSIFLASNGDLKKIGETLVQADLAATLKAINEKGRDGFYKGAVAAEISRASKAGNGLITEKDLADYQVRQMAPVECSYRSFLVISAAPPSSGGVTLCAMLGLLERHPIGAMGFNASQTVHQQIEAMRYSYIDRNTYLGDPDFVKNPVAQMLSKAYIDKIAAKINPDKAGVSSEIRAGNPASEGSNTTHFSIVDREGNAVSVTYTINDWFGARLMAGKTGVLLNNEMDDFTVKPGVANLFGLVQGAANAIAPGKRPLSSMTPTIVLQSGKPFLVLGSPGGSRIITAVLQTIMNVVDHDMTIQEAIDAPRIHHQWLPDTTFVERFALSPDTDRLLRSKGHVLGAPPAPTHVAAIMIGAQRRSQLEAANSGSMRLYGAIDPRRASGSVVGY